jgi:cellulose synthase/poly-beta-1,6-N-acetylglucosamine synthase-like glycosyltransferase
VAIKEGAEVIVRNDLRHRGKGYALDFGIRHLEADPAGVVIFIDADCCVAPDSIDQLVRMSALTMRPVQALYLMHAPRAAGILTRISQFAWTVKNHVRPLGLYKLGLPCQLMGTGMAFPWSCIESARLATDHIVEDLKLGIDLARAGTPPLFCPEALVTSKFPTSREGMREQRTRWEHGHIGVILGEVPRLILDAFRSKDIKLLAFTLDLSVPPLALLALVTCVVWSASAFLYFFTKAQLPLAIATSAVALLAASVLLSWARYGRNIVSLGDLLLAAPYAIWKIPLYARFMIARQKSWVRSVRDDDPNLR